MKEVIKPTGMGLTWNPPTIEEMVSAFMDDSVDIKPTGMGRTWNP